MAKVVSKVQRYDLPPDFMFALQHDDFEACFSSQTKHDMYLDIVFQNKQFSDKKFRDRLEVQGIFQLIKLKYDPTNRLMTEWERANGPWKGVENPIVVEGWIYGVPRKLSREVGLTRPTLQGILLAEVKKLLPKNASWSQRKLTLRLLAKECAVECTTTTWNEEKQPQEATKLVKLTK